MVNEWFSFSFRKRWRAMTALGKDNFPVLPFAPLADVQRARALERGQLPHQGFSWEKSHRHHSQRMGYPSHRHLPGPGGVGEAAQQGATGAPKCPASISESQGHSGRARGWLTRRLVAGDWKKSRSRYWFEFIVQGKICIKNFQNLCKSTRHTLNANHCNLHSC